MTLIVQLSLIGALASGLCSGSAVSGLEEGLDGEERKIGSDAVGR